MSQSAVPMVTHIISGDIWAGAEVQAYQLCRALQASGQVKVSAVVFNPGKLYDKLQALGIPVTLADERQTGGIGLIRAIAKALREHQTTIVHTHGFKENVLGVAAKYLAGIPFSVRTVHGNPEFEVPWYRLAKTATKYLDTLTGRIGQQAIIAVSSQLETRLQHRFGSGKVIRIHNFIDVQALRQQYYRASPSDTPSSPLVLGIIGRLVPVKRVDLFIDTIKVLREHHHIDARGVVFGDGPLKAQLTELAERRGLSPYIRFEGFVDPIYPGMAELNALLMTSDHEGLPMTLLEALALEVPVIAHSVGGIPEVLNHGNAGQLVENHSAEGYAEAVADWQRLHEDKRLAGLDHVLKQFDIKANSAKYLALYQDISSLKKEVVA